MRDLRMDEGLPIVPGLNKPAGGGGDEAPSVQRHFETIKKT